MSRLFETIKLHNGIPVNLAYHQARVDHALSNYIRTDKRIDLSQYVSVPDEFNKGITKWRFIYSRNHVENQFEHYQIRKIQGLKIVEASGLQYEYKYTNRIEINKLVKDIDSDEMDVIFIKDGLVTDASYSNLVFKIGERLVTPSDCLLKGTKRQYYLDRNVISEQIIKVEDIESFEMVSRINAMMDLHTDEWISTKAIIY